MTIADISKTASLALFAFLGAGQPVTAHEFWISPTRGHIAAGGELTAGLKIGQMMQGEPYPYLSNRFQSFTVTVGGKTSDVAGLEGDIPAVNFVAAQSGLHVLAQHTIAFRVTYEEKAVFDRYLLDEGLYGIAELHRQRGLPDIGFAERYTRCAKALIQVGPAQSGDGDVTTGMPLELVAQANPYDPGLTELPVILTLAGRTAGQQADSRVLRKRRGNPNHDENGFVRAGASFI